MKKIYFLAGNSEHSPVDIDARQIMEGIKSKYQVVRVNCKPSYIKKIKNSIVFFTDRHLFLSHINYVSPSNKIITTWWHGYSDSLTNISNNLLNRLLSNLSFNLFGKRINLSRYMPYSNVESKSWKTIKKYTVKDIDDISRKLSLSDVIVCSCSEVKNRLIDSFQVDKKKIKIIPITTDTQSFSKSSSLDERLLLKKKYGIPPDHIVIPNCMRDTQMDGSPKHEKAPEIFAKVVKNLNKKNNIFVVLTSNRRDFMEKSLSNYGVKFKRITFPEYSLVSDAFKISDISIITSREEGGPKQLIESMSAGLPIVSTSQGMALDYIEHGVNGYLTAIDDVDKLTFYSNKIISDKKISENFIRINLDLSLKFDYKKIAKYYFKILENLK